MYRFISSRPFFLRLFIKTMRFWPPYLGTGIFIKDISPTFDKIAVGMRLRFYNRNIVGVHFGGSLYSMCDPFYMLIVMVQLGKAYIVWDKAAEIQFIKPGRGFVCVEFEVSEEQLETIRRAVAGGEKYEPVFEARILDESNELVALVKKKLYVKLKKT